MAELFASPHRALSDENWSFDLEEAEEKFEIISKNKTVSLTWVCDQLCSSLKKYPKEMGWNFLKNLDGKNYLRRRD